MRRFRWVLGVVVLGLAGALVGVVPDGVSAVPARTPCRATAFVTNTGSGTVSTIDVKTRTKHPTDITVGSRPDSWWRSRRTARPPSSPTGLSGTVSTIDVKTRTKNPTDIAVGTFPFGVAVTPDGKTAFVANGSAAPVSTIDVKTRTKNPTDITVGSGPFGVAVTPGRQDRLRHQPRPAAPCRRLT